MIVESPGPLFVKRVAEPQAIYQAQRTENVRVVHRLVKFLPEKISSVVGVGCGTGHLTIPIADAILSAHFDLLGESVDSRWAD